MTAERETISANCPGCQQRCSVATLVPQSEGNLYLPDQTLRCSGCGCSFIVSVAVLSGSVIEPNVWPIPDLAGDAGGTGILFLE